MHDEYYNDNTYFWDRELPENIDDYKDPKHIKRDEQRLFDEKLHNQLPVLFTFTFIHDLFSYFIFCILSTVIDIATIKKLKESLEEKTRTSSNNSAAKKEEKEKAEMRSIIMVVLNSLSIFVFRSTELVSIVLFYVITFVDGPYTFKMLCFDFHECLTINELANFSYTASLSLNFFFFLFFNKVFKHAFKLLFEMSKIKPLNA